MSEENQSHKALHFLKIFEEGRRFTEELLKENERLRQLNEKFRIEKDDLQNQYVKVEVPHIQEKYRLLEEEVRKLREENQGYKDRYQAIESENREFADRFIQVQRQNSNLVNMYVATYRLHSTLEYEEVLKAMKEIVINMIGSESFGIYICDQSGNQLHLIAHEGLENKQHASIPIGEGVVGEAIRRKTAYIAKPGESGGGEKNPLAVIPLKVGETMLGVILVHHLLNQKSGFETLDHDLFDLLGGQAATALYCSKMYSDSERKRSTLEGFLKLLKK